MALHKFRSFEIAEDAQGASFELWRGETEVVCLASDPRRLQFVELHILAASDAGSDDPAAVDSFRARAQGAMRLCHPNVAEVREFGEDEGTLFFVTDFVDGESLESYLARCNPLPVWLTVEMARQAVEGLLAVRVEPSLLAQIDLFNARLSLEGETTGNLVVKLCDLGLGRPPVAGAATDHERRCTRDVGRLMLYALSGLISDKLTASSVASLPLPPELAGLLARLLESPARHSISELPALAEALVACQKGEAVATRPDRLPVTLRPRLPLQAEFCALPQLAEKLGGTHRLERTAFDALQPYSQRAFGPGAQVASVQLLPPARLMAPGHAAFLRQAAQRIKPGTHPHLVRVLELPPDEAPAFFIEESPPRLTVDGARRLRKGLTAAEVTCLLQHIEKAVIQAEKLDLPPVAVTPQQLFIEFISGEGTTPPAADDSLGSIPLTEWPAFRVRLRTYPTTLQSTQPHRFRAERLLGKGVRSSREPGPAGLRAPGAGDYAALAVALLGGEAQVPEAALALVQQALAGVGELTRKKFLEQLSEALAPKPPRSGRGPAIATARSNGRTSGRPESPAPARASGARSASSPRDERKPKSRGIAPRTVGAKPVAGRSVRPDEVVPAAEERPETPLPLERPTVAAAGVDETIDFGALNRTGGVAVGDDETAGGFAEVLFAEPRTRPVEATAAEEESPVGEDVPIGGIFATGRPSESADDDEAAEVQQFDFRHLDQPRRSIGTSTLVLMVVIAALIIALIMAHVTGLAPWTQ